MKPDYRQVRPIPIGFKEGNSHGMKKVLVLLTTLVALAQIFPGRASAQYAYVANLGSNNVSVINLENNSVTATVGVGNTPRGIAVNPEGTFAYVANYNDNTVSVINAATNTVTATITVGGAGSGFFNPYGIAVNPAANFVYVLGQNADQVAVVNATTNTLYTTVAVGTSPYAIAVLPNGTSAYVTNFNSSIQQSNGTYSDGIVSVINANSNTVTTTVTAGINPAGVAVNPAGTLAYVANNGGANVSVINTNSNAVTATIAVGSGPKGIAVSPSGNLVFVANNNDNTVSVINAANNTVTATLNVGDGPVDVAFNPAGTYAYVTNTVDGTVSVINTGSNAVVATIPVGQNPVGIAIGGPAGPVSISAGGFQNAGGFVTPPVAPGSLVDVYGNFPVATAQASGAPWPSSLSGLSMQFNGVQAPFYFASSGQANVQVPWELAGQTQASVTAAVGGDTSPARSLNLTSAAPGIFTLNAQNQGAILDASFKVIGPSNPATAGSSYILVYCTGLGPVTNQPATGSVALSSPLSYATLATTVTIGGVQTTPYFSGLAPGFVGVYQINVLVPAGVAAGSAVPMSVSVNGVSSNTVTVAVQQ